MPEPVVEGPAAPLLAPSMLAPFRYRIFALVWAGALISNIGNWMENAAQSWAVVHAPSSSASHTAFLAEILQVADFAPVLFLSLLAGVISDRVNRKAWLIILQAAGCLLGAGLAAAAFMGHATPWVVIGFTFVEGMVWALNGPAWLSVPTMLIPRSELHRALALNSVQFNLARLIGPLLASLVIAQLDIPWAFTINAASFALVIYALARLPKQERPTAPRKPAYQELRGGLSFTWKHPGIRRLTLMGSIFMFFSAPVQGLLAVFAQQVLHSGSTLYGFMLGAIGLGSVLGALLLSHLPSYYPRHHLIPLSMCLFAVVAVTYSFSTNAVLSVVILVGAGVVWLMSLNPTNTANQLLATDDNRGRVMSVMLLANQGAMTLGHFTAGMLAHVLSPQWIVRSMAMALFVCMSVMLFLREPAIDNQPRRGRRKLSAGEHLWEAITAHSHRPSQAADPLMDVEDGREEDRRG